MKSKSILHSIVFGNGTFALILNLCLATSPALAGNDSGVAERTKESVKEAAAAVEVAAKDVKVSVQDAGRAVGNSFEKLWQQVDANRLQNRSRDEIVAWVIVGILVGAVAGLMTSLKPTGMGKLGRLLLGLAGAALGGIVARVAGLDFGWGPVLIRYEELFVSFLGAIALIILVRLLRSGAHKATSK